MRVPIFLLEDNIMNIIRLPVKLLDNNKPIQPIIRESGSRLEYTVGVYYVSCEPSDRWNVIWSDTAWGVVPEDEQDYPIFPRRFKYKVIT
jgi:hypothetical protein